MHYLAQAATSGAGSWVKVPIPKEHEDSCIDVCRGVMPAVGDSSWAHVASCCLGQEFGIQFARSTSPSGLIALFPQYGLWDHPVF